MDRGIGRRRFFGVGMAALGGLMPIRAIGAPHTARDYCGWRRERDPICSGGWSKEYWCQRCCDRVNGCTVIRCEWRTIGSC